MSLVNGMDNDTVVAMFAQDAAPTALKVVEGLRQKGVKVMTMNEVEEEAKWGEPYFRVMGWMVETAKRVLVFWSDGLARNGQWIRIVYRADEAGKYLPIMTGEDSRSFVPAILADIVPARFNDVVDEQQLSQLANAINRQR